MIPRRLIRHDLGGRDYEEDLLQMARKNGADSSLSKNLPSTQLLMEIKCWLRQDLKPLVREGVIKSR
jgi:hypothetical protein